MITITHGGVRRVVALAALATAGLTSLTGAATEASMDAPAEVVCSASSNYISVTPIVRSDKPHFEQWAAVRVWIAHWNGSTWDWTSTDWEYHRATTPRTQLLNHRYDRADGYYYIYVESWMWEHDFGEWMNYRAEYTTEYTQRNQSPNPAVTSTDQQEQFCRL